MSILEEALVEVAALLDELGIRYMLIGGVAVGLWGEPRATLDLDVAVWIESDQFESTLQTLLARLRPRITNPLESARVSRVLSVQALNGVPVDLLFSAWPIEKEAIQAAQARRIGGVDVRVATLEYLLYLKLISERPKDLADAAALLRRHRGKADLSWLEAELASLSESVAQPEILQRFVRILRET